MEGGTEPTRDLEGPPGIVAHSQSRNWHVGLERLLISNWLNSIHGTSDDRTSQDGSFRLTVPDPPQVPLQTLERSHFLPPGLDIECRTHLTVALTSTGENMNVGGADIRSEPSTSRTELQCPSLSTSYEDSDEISLASSTLPPSYRTHPSLLDLPRRSLTSPPPLSPQLPSIPPSAYRRHPRGSRGINERFRVDVQAIALGNDTLPVSTETRERWEYERVEVSRRRARDGGVRLEGGRPGSLPVEREVADSEDLGIVESTRPPPYSEGQ